MRKAEITRKTAETEIYLSINLDGKGDSDIASGNGFFDHMLTLFARHGGFDLVVKCTGDTDVDFHHSAEDIGICLGSAFCKALSDKRGITRYAHIMLPMDEALISGAVDISGRRTLVYNVETPRAKVGEFDTELTEEFMTAFVMNAAITLHIKSEYGTNTHHIIEGTFKALGRMLSAAVAIDPKRADMIPSTKGAL